MKQPLFLVCAIALSIGCSRHYPKDIQNEFLIGCTKEGSHLEYTARCRCYLNIIEETWPLQEFLDRSATATTLEDLFPRFAMNRMLLECPK